MELPHNMLLVLQALKGKAVEVTLRGGDDIDGVIDDCNAGVVQIGRRAPEGVVSQIEAEIARVAGLGGSPEHLADLEHDLAEAREPDDRPPFYIRTDDVSAVRELSANSGPERRLRY